MICFRNTQRSVQFDKKRIMHDAQKILSLLKYGDFDLGILITNDATIRRYNREFRGIDKPTDILSFSYHPNLKAGARIRARSDDDKNLGDLIISAPYVARESIKYHGTIEEKMRILLVHGICHLLGYDHEIESDYLRMRAKEAFILKKLSL